MRFLMALMMLPLLSCTTVENRVVVLPQEKEPYIDSEFNPIIQSFIYEAESRGHKVDLNSLTITLRDIRVKGNERVLGYCAPSKMNGIVIRINTSTWRNMDKYQQEVLVFHELAHGLMGREHCSQVKASGPVSIMHPRILDSGYYKLNREELIDELFNISAECLRDDGHADEVDGKVRPPSHYDSRR